MGGFFSRAANNSLHRCQLSRGMSLHRNCVWATMLYLVTVAPRCARVVTRKSNFAGLAGWPGERPSHWESIFHFADHFAPRWVELQMRACCKKNSNLRIRLACIDPMCIPPCFGTIARSRLSKCRSLPCFV